MKALISSVRQAISDKIRWHLVKFILLPLMTGGLFINNVLQLQIDCFCNDICCSVETWLNDNKDNKEIEKRINELMRVHPISSLEPFIARLIIIACVAFTDVYA